MATKALYIALILNILNTLVYSMQDGIKLGGEEAFDIVEIDSFMISTTDDNGSDGSDDGFEWDWDAWYSITSFIVGFVIITVTIVYCACTWHDGKYGPDKQGDHYGSMMMARAPSFTEEELSRTAV